MLRHRNWFHSPQCNSMIQDFTTGTYTDTYSSYIQNVDTCNRSDKSRAWNTLQMTGCPSEKEESACRDMLKYFHVARLNIYIVMRNEKESQSWISPPFLFPWQSAHVKAIWPVARVSNLFDMKFKYILLITVPHGINICYVCSAGCLTLFPRKDNHANYHLIVYCYCHSLHYVCCGGKQVHLFP